MTPLVLYHVEVLDKVTARLTIITAGTLGSILLATVTAFSFFLNWQRLNKDRMESLRPLVKDEIAVVMQPAIDKLNHNEGVINDNAVNWAYLDPQVAEENPLPAMGTPELLVKNPDFRSLDKSVLRRFESRHRDLYERMRDHDKKLEEASNTSQEVVEEIQEELRSYIKDNNIKKGESGDLVQPKVICDLLLNQEKGMGDYFKENVWEPHKEDYLEILDKEVSQEKIEIFRKAKRDYVDCVGQIKAELEKAQANQLEKYKISREEIESEKTQNTL